MLERDQPGDDSHYRRRELTAGRGAHQPLCAEYAGYQGAPDRRLVRGRRNARGASLCEAVPLAPRNATCCTRPTGLATRADAHSRILLHVITIRALPFVSTPSPYREVLRRERRPVLNDLQVVVYGWSLAPTFTRERGVAH